MGVATSNRSTARGAGSTRGPCRFRGGARDVRVRQPGAVPPCYRFGMNRIAMMVAAALALAACSQDPESNLPAVPEGLYRVDGPTLYCDGAAEVLPTNDVPTEVVCVWRCLYVDGRDVEALSLTFQRAGPDDAWRHTFTAWTFGACD